MSEKVLSIIIPTYNMENYISKCLDSLLIPSVDLIEVLVINDGSKDKTSEIAHKYAEKYPQSIRIIDKENGNYGSCINRGLKEATGKYVKVLDADDSFDTDNLEKFIQFLRKRNEELVFSNYTKCNNNRIYTEKTYSIEPLKTVQFKEIIEKEAKMTMHSVAYLRSIFKKFKYEQTEGISYTDWEWVFLPLAYVYSACYFNKNIYNYLIGREGQTVTFETMQKNVDQLITVATSLLLTYKNLPDTIPEPNKNYLKGALKILLKFIYDILLLHYRKGNDKIMNEFDSIVIALNGILYEELNMEKTRYGVYYIKLWRKRKHLPVYFQLLNKSYYQLSNLKSKIFKRN